MSTEIAVAGSVDVAQLERLESDALAAIESVTEPDEAERLLAKVKAVQEAQRLARLGADYEVRWSRVSLRSERKYGELLGPAEPGGNGNRVTGSYTEPAERMAASRARQVAQVPDEVFEDFMQNAKVINRARLLRTAREAEAEKTRDEGVEPESTHGDDIWIVHGDLADVLPDSDITGATIISDPPYPREFLPAWGKLAEVARDGCADQLVLMSGQSLLPEVMEQVESAGWQYRWTGAYLTPGPATRVWNAKVGTSWKPILVYDRGDGREFVTRDLFQSTGDDKRHHYWGQNEEGFAQIVEAFTEPGDLVVDPFLGGGTTAIVCRDLGRRFLGCDIDAAAVATTRERLEATS